MKKFTIITFMLLTGLLSYVNGSTVQTFNPTANGFVRQATDDGLWTYQNVEVKNYSGYNREMFMDFDLQNLTITPAQATLRLYCSAVTPSTGESSYFIISALGLSGNYITGDPITLKWSTRPTTGVRTVDVQAGIDSVGKWLEFDVTDFIKSLDLTQSQLIGFQIAVRTTGGPLVKISTTYTSYKPQLVISDTPTPGIYELPYSAINTAVVVGGTYNTSGDPIYALNGDGLLPQMQHEAVADYKSWRNVSGSFPYRFIVGLTNEINLKKLHIWNFNWTGNTGRSMKDVDIYYSNSSDDLTGVAYDDSRWTLLKSVVLTQATGDATFTGDEVVFTNSVASRWVGLNIKDIYGTDVYTGMSEMKIYKEITSSSSGPVTDNKDIYSDDFNVFSKDGTLTINNIKLNTPIKVYDMYGQVIYNQTAQSSTIQINLQKGIYIIKSNNSSIKVINK